MKFDAPFECSNAEGSDLKGLLDKAIRSTSVYAECEAKGLFKGRLGVFPRADKKLTRRIREECTAAIREYLYERRDELPEGLQKEVERLNQALLGVVTGYGAPALHVTNLPEGMAGVMAVTGLMAYSANIQTHDKHEPSELNQIKRTGVLTHSHAKQPTHRDSRWPLITALVGLHIGEEPLATVFHTTQDVVEETARHYRKALDGTAEDAPLDDALLEEVRGLMTNRCYRFSLRIHDHPLLIPDPKAGEGALRLNPRFTGPGHPLLKLAPHLQEDRVDDVPKQRMLTEAFKKSIYSLKEKDGIVIGPQEAVIFNDSFVTHGAGNFVDDARTGPGTSRELVTVAVYPTQEQHKLPYKDLEGTRLNWSLFRDQGYVQLMDEIGTQRDGH